MVVNLIVVTQGVGVLTALEKTLLAQQWPCTLQEPSSTAMAPGLCPCSADKP